MRQKGRADKGVGGHRSEESLLCGNEAGGSVEHAGRFLSLWCCPILCTLGTLNCPMCLLHVRLSG